MSQEFTFSDVSEHTSKVIPPAHRNHAQTNEQWN